jgi:signal transduction histidine kinase
VNWLRLVPLLLLGIANVLIAGAVLTRDFKKFNNVAFATLALSIASWVFGIAGFLFTRDEHAALLWAQLYYAAPLFIALSGVFFALSFPYSEKNNNVIRYPLLGGFAAMFLPLIFHRSFLMRGLVYHSWGKEVLLNYMGYSLYVLYILVFFVAILLLMYIRAKRLGGLYALQANLFFQGLSITAVFGLLFNLILPFFGNYRLIGLGPLFTSISVSVIGYSIVRHRMFDIRLVIARSLGYVMSLVVLASIYGFIVFGIAQFIFGVHLKVITQMFLAGASGIAALSFNKLKTNFDKLTNRLFYRDAYDAQDLFDNLNQVLVSTLDLDKLLHKTSDLLAGNLKAQFCLIGLKEIIGRPQRIIGTEKRNISFDDIMAARKLTINYHQSVIATDLLEPRYEKLKTLLLRNDISVLVRLSPHVNKNEEGLGYIAFGPKRSGNPYSNQDYRVLDTVANELIIAIQNALHFEEIQNFNKTLQQKVVEATNQLRRTNEKLKALDETKDDFISMASHQLRTPLTSVKGYVSLVLDGDAGSIKKEQRQLLNQAFASSQRMVYLISDLLNVSRLKTGKFIIEPAPVNLADMIGEEIDQLHEMASVKNITLSYTKPRSFPELMFDETKLRQVVMNFADNAIHYTPSGGKVSVELEDKGPTVELRVKDDGIGVPKAEQHHLFTKFYRAGNARKTRPDGTGLGLFMAKKVIIAQGGSLVFESQEGKGSTFGFTFSKSKLAVPTSTPDKF